MLKQGVWYTHGNTLFYVVDDHGTTYRLKTIQTISHWEDGDNTIEFRDATWHFLDSSRGVRIHQSQEEWTIDGPFQEAEPKDFRYHIKQVFNKNVDQYTEETIE